MNSVPSSKVSAFAPATLANVGVGFDVLGLALAPLEDPNSLWGDVVHLEPGPQFELRCVGPFGKAVPQGSKNNVVTRVIERYLDLERVGDSERRITVTLEKRLPIGSGLGSSASSAAAAAMGIDAYFGRRWDRDRLLDLAAYGEGVASGAEHRDNVAPALRGGILLIPSKGQIRPLPWPSGWTLVVVTPDFRIETRRSREVLPKHVPLETAVDQAARLAAFVAALYESETDSLREIMRDGLAEPHRSALLPGFEAVRCAAMDAGALGCGFSGSGPTVFALGRTSVEVQRIGSAMVEAFASAGLQSRARTATIDPTGTRILDGDIDPGCGS